MVYHQVESWSKISTVKHCSGSRRITSCAWSHAHDMMQVVFWLHLARVSSVDLIAEHGACNDLLTCGYPLCSNVWLIAHHIVHTSSSAWHCMRTSCTFLRCTRIHTQNMKMIVLCLSMISKRFRIINQGTVECSKPGERKVNNIEEFVYALYGCTVFFVWLRLRIRWCAWSHTCDIMQANLNPWFVTRQNHEARETLLWLPTHHIMHMISYARHDVGDFLIASATGVVH